MNGGLSDLLNLENDQNDDQRMIVLLMEKTFYSHCTLHSKVMPLKAAEYDFDWNKLEHEKDIVWMAENVMKPVCTF